MANESEKPDGVLIDQAAERTGLTKRSIRYYEELGLLPATARSDGNYRRYGEADLARLARIGRLRNALGLSLDEVGRVLGVEDELDDLRRRINQDGAAAAEQDQDLARCQSLLEGYRNLLAEKVGVLQAELAAVGQRLERVAARRTGLADPDGPQRRGQA